MAQHKAICFDAKGNCLGVLDEVVHFDDNDECILTYYYMGKEVRGVDMACEVEDVHLLIKMNGAAIDELATNRTTVRQ